RRQPAPRLFLQREHADRVTALLTSTDGSRLISASMDSTVKLWRTADRMLEEDLAYHLVGATCIALSPDGGLLLSGDGSGRVRAWDISERRERVTPPAPHEGGVGMIAFLPGGSQAVSSDFRGAAWLWTLSGPTLRARRILEQATITTLAVPC